MSKKIYCDKCGQAVVLDDLPAAPIGICVCGYSITEHFNAYTLKHSYEYKLMSPPDLGVSVSDGIGLKDEMK